jgi:hypothetical protein
MVHADGVRPGWFHPILRSSDVPGYRVGSIRMLSSRQAVPCRAISKDRFSARGGIVPARGTDRSSIIRAFGGCLGIERR